MFATFKQFEIFNRVIGRVTIFMMYMITFRNTDVPVNAMKGYYGHTLGAAGVLETLLSMRAVEAGVVPATRGFDELGVSMPVPVSSEAVDTQKNAFVKLLSGFGGCNAAAAFVRV